MPVPKPDVTRKPYRWEKKKKGRKKKGKKRGDEGRWGTVVKVGGKCRPCRNSKTFERNWGGKKKNKGAE